MRIRMFSLCAERDLAQRKLEAKIAEALHGFASNTLEFEDFSAPQDMLAPLAQSLKNEEMTVVAVEKKAYNKIKKKILPAMGYALERNEEIYSALEGRENLDDQKRESHSLFPKDATVFRTEDSLFSGLGINKGGRLFIMLPLDRNRIPDMLKGGVLPYLLENNFQPVSDGDEIPEEPVKKESRVISSNPLVRSVNLLKEANSRVAFCANKQQNIISSVISDIGVGEELFLFSPHVEDKGEIDIVSYSVQLARAAKNLSHTELGAVVSDPFDDENGRGVCLSITDGEKAIARRFYAQEGETDDSLIRAAAEETIALLGQNAYGVLEDNSVSSDAPETEKIAEKKTVKRVFIVLAVVLAICLALGIMFKILNDRKNREPETTEPTTVSTTADETEPTAEPVEKVNILKSVVDTFLTRGENDKVGKGDKAPAKFKLDGIEVDAKETLALIVQKNINDADEWNEEALKAQVVAIFTCLKYRNNGFDVSDVELANTADAKVKDAVNAVYGDFLTYKDEVIPAFFHRSSAGKTASSESVYGKAAPYLVSVNVPTDARMSDFKSEIKIDTTTYSNMIYKATGSNLTDSNPAEWVKITKQDQAVDNNTGYVLEINAGGTVLTGYDYIQKIDVNSKTPLTSLCFTVTYLDSSKEFIFTCYGMGSGVGMSQRGAISMGKTAKYEDILKAFYPETELNKGEASTAAETTTKQATKTNTTTRTNNGGTSTKTTTTTAAPDTTKPTEATQPDTTKPTEDTQPDTTPNETPSEDNNTGNTDE